MATGKASDFQVYQEYFDTGFSEALEQETNAFNGASNNAIRLLPRRIKGHYEYQSLFANISGLVSRRDITSVSAATDTAMTQVQEAGVKLNRKIGPIGQTKDAFRKLGRDPMEISYVLGQQMGKAVACDYVNTSVGCLKAALSAQATLTKDGMAGTITHSMLNLAMAKLGDASKRVTCWVMHSKAYHDLVGQAIADKITNVADVTIYSGTVGSFGRPVIVTDAPALYYDTTTDEYYTLGLVQDACLIEESEERDIEVQTITGLENLVVRLQGEYAYNIRLKGITWDVTNGGANPDDTALTTTTNWDKVAASVKSLPGVFLKTQ